jgi:hypothetical protein
MKTSSSHLIRAFFAHRWGSSTTGSLTRDAVPASRVRYCGLPGIRALRVLKRLSFRATTDRQRCLPSFNSSGWVLPFVPDSATPPGLRPCAGVSIAPGIARRRPD